MPDPMLSTVQAADVQPVGSLLSSAPIIPPGIPPTDPNKPKWALTQEQIDFLVATVTSFWPAFRSYWPIIVLIASAFGVGGALTGRYVVPTTPTPIVTPEGKPVAPVVVAPVSPVAPVSRTTYAVTPATDLSILKTLPSGNVETYPVGSKYNFRGTIYPLPVVITRDAAGTDIEVKKLP